ncbi:response regulator [Psychromonas sp. 14N.309.X.WAT.B.A12]|jgi:CheY-like chemotaxis protein|uniref:response regulator n=1 Tax=unclassified Psychromonas TaxID=2614957 RepID=UPI0025B24942|nr:response regulator [Psychromonas sp. 14N.309.X.WAT.B.A12]MDN2663435.1 response regulator [Psychromonas sp. 14N.309.X.WAT.B.A12]
MEYSEVSILLVEDDDIDAKAVERGFKKLKLANPITRAKNGVDALAILREPAALVRPYIILLDLNMPIMGGVEFLKHIRQDDRLKDSIIFVLTTSSADQDVVAAYNENIAGYIVKSDVKAGFDKVIKLLDCYWRVVMLPK